MERQTEPSPSQAFTLNSNFLDTDPWNFRKSISTRASSVSSNKPWDYFTFEDPFVQVRQQSRRPSDFVIFSFGNMTKGCRDDMALPSLSRSVEEFRYLDDKCTEKNSTGHRQSSWDDSEIGNFILSPSPLDTQRNQPSRIEPSPMLRNQDKKSLEGRFSSEHKAAERQPKRAIERRRRRRASIGVISGSTRRDEEERSSRKSPKKPRSSSLECPKRNGKDDDRKARSRHHSVPPKREGDKDESNEKSHEKDRRRGRSSRRRYSVSRSSKTMRKDAGRRNSVSPIGKKRSEHRIRRHSVDSIGMDKSEQRRAERSRKSRRQSLSPPEKHNSKGRRGSKNPSERKRRSRIDSLSLSERRNSIGRRGSLSPSERHRSHRTGSLSPSGRRNRSRQNGSLSPSEKHRSYRRGSLGCSEKDRIRRRGSLSISDQNHHRRKESSGLDATGEGKPRRRQRSSSCPREQRDKSRSRNHSSSPSKPKNKQVGDMERERRRGGRRSITRVSKSKSDDDNSARHGRSRDREREIERSRSGSLDNLQRRDKSNNEQKPNLKGKFVRNTSSTGNADHTPLFDVEDQLYASDGEMGISNDNCRKSHHNAVTESTRWEDDRKETTKAYASNGCHRHYRSVGGRIGYEEDASNTPDRKVSSSRHHRKHKSMDDTTDMPYSHYRHNSADGTERDMNANRQRGISPRRHRSEDYDGRLSPGSRKLTVDTERRRTISPRRKQKSTDKSEGGLKSKDALEANEKLEYQRPGDKVELRDRRSPRRTSSLGCFEGMGAGPRHTRARSMDHTISAFSSNGDGKRRHLRKSRMDFLNNGLPFGGDSDNESLEDSQEYGTQEAQDRLVRSIQERMRGKEEKEKEGNSPNLEPEEEIIEQSLELLDKIDFTAFELDETKDLLERAEKCP